eukprot:15480998-Alexandrium_andersonii.AAC.1
MARAHSGGLCSIEPHSCVRRGLFGARRAGSAHEAHVPHRGSRAGGEAAVGLLERSLGGHDGFTTKG